MVAGNASSATERLKTVSQCLAILGLAGICFMVLHKGYTDIGALAREHHGQAFWLELVRHIFRNLAG